jgi:deazaflavin-dependent oxidoreductase (nitroreductase family)
MPDWDPEAFQSALLADMRAHGGQVTQGGMKGEPVLFMTYTGVKSGLERRTVLNFSRDDDAYVVAGTAGGAPTDPKWVANVRANPMVSVEADGGVFEGLATVAENELNPERIRLWNQHVATIPRFGAYPEKTGRAIPMVRITPKR